jgi:uncharacterized membrane protein YjjP (DUF1212 family)
LNIKKVEKMGKKSEYLFFGKLSNCLLLLRRAGEWNTFRIIFVATIATIGTSNSYITSRFASMGLTSQMI